MIPDYLISIFKVALVGVILLGMIVVLLGINHVTHNDDSLSSEETNLLRREVTDDRKVITPRSVFHNFLARSMKRSTKTR